MSINWHSQVCDEATEAFLEPAATVEEDASAVISENPSFTLEVRDTPIFWFPEDNLSKCQGILTKLGTCINMKEIWFGIANGQISSMFDRVICPRHDNSGILQFNFFNFYYLKVKEVAAQHVFRPAMNIVDDDILDNVKEDNRFLKPKETLLKRAANRFRAKMRPSEPEDLAF